MSKKNTEAEEFCKTRRIEMNFRVAMNGIKYFVNNVGPVAFARDEAARKTRERIKEGISSLLTDGSILGKRKVKPKEKLNINEEKLSSTVDKIISLTRDYDYAGVNVTLNDELHRGLLLQGSFMMMIASFDFLLSDLLHCYYEKYPKALNSDMVLSLGDLRKCADLDEAINILVEKKIETVLFDNFANQMLFFEDKMKIGIAKEIINWDRINEAYQRRNIFAHNNGVVNKRYLSHVRVLPEGEVKIGQRLVVNIDYFLGLYWEMLTGGIVLAQNCWRKWFKSDITHADSALIDCINRELLQKLTGTATKLLLYSRKIETGSEQARYDLDVLLCQLLKIVGLKEKFTQEIRKLEKVASSNKRLADIAALKDDKETFYKHIENAARNGEIYKSDLELVAIYQDLYNDVDFKKKLDEIFKYE
jgi:hypothetical protein